MKIFTFFALTLVISGCAQLGHKEFYSQIAPKKYPTTDKVMIFEYRNVDLIEIYDLLYSDFLIIGKSAFNGPYENPAQSGYYAKSIGADIFITTSQFKETRTSFVTRTRPTTSRTYISGYSGTSSVYGTVTTYGTRTTTVPVRVNRYDQDSMFLKNVDNVNPMWERTIVQYEETRENPLSGIWENENYRIEIYQSGEQLVAFIDEVLKGGKSWSKGQLKMIFGIESEVGIYLMGNKTPIPSSFNLNKFGHLEIKLLTTSETFSFEKMQ